FVSELAADLLAVRKDTWMEPGLGIHRWHVRGSADVRGIGEAVTGAERGVLLGVPLLDHAEATELALNAIEVAVVIGITGDEAVTAEAVEGVDAFDHVHWEWQPGDPWCAR